VKPKKKRIEASKLKEKARKVILVPRTRKEFAISFLHLSCLID
jgi:hypothetical protein